MTMAMKFLSRLSVTPLQVEGVPQDGWRNVVDRRRLPQ